MRAAQRGVHIISGFNGRFHKGNHIDVGGHRFFHEGNPSFRGGWEVISLPLSVEE